MASKDAEEKNSESWRETKATGAYFFGDAFLAAFFFGAFFAVFLTALALVTFLVTFFVAFFGAIGTVGPKELGSMPNYVFCSRWGGFAPQICGRISRTKRSRTSGVVPTQP